MIEVKEDLNIVQADTNAPDVVAPEKTGIVSAFGSAMALNNPLTSLFVNESYQSAFDDYDPEYNPEEDMGGFEEYKEVLIKAKDDTHMKRLKKDIQTNNQMRAKIDNAGAMALPLSFLAGMTDPIGLIPTLKVASGSIKATTKGGSALTVAKESGKVATAAAGSVALSEMALQQLQPTLTAQDSIEAIGIGALLGGFIGAGAKGLSLSSAKDVGGRLKKDINESVATPERQAKMEDIAVKEYNSTVGAMRTPKMTKADLELVNTFGVSKASSFISPTLRIMNGSSTVAKNIYTKLAETNLKVKGLYDGKAMPVSAETLAKDYDRFLAKAVKVSKDNYKNLKTRLKQEGKPVIKKQDYKTRIAQALRRGDQDIYNDPDITKAAQQIRQEFFNPIKERAVKVGLLPEEIEAKFAESYLTRVWNPKAIVEDMPKFKEKLLDWAETKVRKQVNVLNNYKNNTANTSNKRINEYSDVIKRNNELLSDLETNKVKLDYKNITDVDDQYLDFLKREISVQELNAYIDRYDLGMVAELINQAKIKTPRKPQGIASEIVSRGGIKFDGDLKSAGITSRSRVGIFNKDGLGLDVMYRDLQESGWFIGDDVINEADELRQAVIEDLNGSGYYNIDDIDATIQYDNILELKEEAEEALNRLGFSNWKTFYKDIKEDIKLTKRGLKKEAKEIRAKVKVQKQGASKVAKTNKDIISEVNKLRSEKVRKIKSDNVKAENKIKALEDRRNKNLEKADEELRKFFDPTNESSIKLYSQDIVNEITDNLARVNPNPDIPPYISPLSRGPLKEKLLDVRDEDFEDFLDNDIDSVMSYYRHHMGTQIELKRNFDSIDLKDEVAEISEDYTKLIDNAPDSKARKKLVAEKKQAIEDVIGVKDILLGRYDKSNPDTVFSQGLTVLKDVQYMAKMGGVVLSSLPDVSRIIMTNGLDNLVGGFNGKLLKTELGKFNRVELEELGLSLEAELNTRLNMFADLSDPLARGTALTRFTGNATQIFSKVTLMNYWNDLLKSTAGLSGQQKMIRSLGSPDKHDKAYLRSLGVEEWQEKLLQKQINKHGKKHLSGIKDWDYSEAGVEEVARVWRGAIRKIADETIVTKSAGDLPLFSNVKLGSVFLQFKSFLIASHSKVLLKSLQARGEKEVAGTITGAIAMVAMGMMVAAIKAEMHEKSVGLRGAKNNFDISKWNKRQWLMEGVDRSGLIALILEPLHISDKMMGIGPSMLTGKGVTSRFASRNTLGALLGPTAGTVQDFSATSRMLASPMTGADVSKSDVYALRRMLPFQNAFVFRQMFDILEAETGKTLGAN